MRIRVLTVCDNPNMRTGQGIVHRHICQGLLENGYDVVSLGWSPEHIENKLPWFIYTTEKTKYFGEDLLDQIIYHERPDLLLTIGDVWNFRYVPNINNRKFVQWIAYTAVDGEAHGGCIPESWKPVLKDADRIVTYTNYGKNVIGKSLPEELSKIEVISHGVDINNFYPLSDNERIALRKKYGIADDYIIYLLVARNQFRKNIPEIFKAWKEFKKDNKHEKALLWPHMLFRDPFGNNLDELVKILGIQNSLVFFDEFAHAKSNLDTIPDTHMNQLYNMADVSLCISGEGFGFSLVESMATGKPIIALNHSACAELVNGVGELVDVEYYITGVHNTERPYPSQKSLLEKMDKLYYDVELRQKYGKAGMNRSKLFTWKDIHFKWSKYLRTVIDPLSSNPVLDIIS